MTDSLDSFSDGTPSAPNLTDLIDQHPLLAVAAAAAAGAGVVALVAAATSPRGPGPSRLTALGEQAADTTAELQAQLRQWVSRLNAALPTREEAADTARGLGGEATKLFDTLAGTARQSVQGAAQAGAQLTQTAAAHPVWTSVLLGAVGTAIAAAVAASAQQASPPPDEHEPLGGMPPDTPSSGYTPTGEATL